MASKKDVRTVDEVITLLPKEERLIVKRLRAIILECLPKATEKNNYGVPFYTHHRMICFIWPPSVYWGPQKEQMNMRGVTLGFCQGNLMANDQGLLLAEGRKQVYCMYFNSLNEINEDQIRPLLYEAELIDDAFGEKKRGKKKNRH
jgi:hypothetical protein